MTTTLPLTPARRAALVFGVPLCLALTGAAGLAIVEQVGQASFPVSYEIAASTKTINVNVGGGNLTVRPVNGGQGSFAGIVTYTFIRPRVVAQAAGGVASYGLDCATWVGTCELNATLSVPRQAAMSVSTGGGNVTATGLAGDVSLSTSGGDVTADGMTGAFSLSTGGGNVQATAVAAIRVSAQTGGGDIEIVFTTVPRDIQVSTGGGDVTIVLPAGSAEYHVLASTGGGTITDPIPINTLSPNVITATSGGGNITITEPT